VAKPDKKRKRDTAGVSRLSPGLGRAWLAAKLRFARTRLGRWGMGATRFVLVPPQLALADPSVATDILAGQVVLAGKSVLLSGTGLFEVAPPNPAFARALHSFVWLRHFEASPEAGVRAGALALISNWMDRREDRFWPEAENPAVIARRLIAFTLHSGLIGAQPDLAGYARVLHHMTMDAAMLKVLAGQRGIGMVRLEAAIGLIYYALAMDRAPDSLWRAEALLMGALRECVLHDGAPRNRDPGTATMLAAMLVPLLALYRARSLDPPEVLSQGLQRLIGFMRLMQQPDGGLALFNGGGLVERDLVAEVTGFASATLARPHSAPDAGFERRENEHGILIVDTGPLPEAAFAAQAGASALAFEFSTRAERLIVNCGLPVGADEATRRYFRTAAAHSSVLIDDIGPVTLMPAPTLLDAQAHGLGGGDGLEPQDAPDGTLQVGHAGLSAQTGYVIERRFRLVPEGGLEGCDVFRELNERGEIRRGTLVFHLHPQVIPVPLSRRDGVVLRLPNQKPGQDLWLFEAPGHTLAVEESRCYLDDFSQAKTECLVLEAAISGTTMVRWRISRYFG
jgi:uncharacterized heparinase superfamily protein